MRAFRFAESPVCSLMRSLWVLLLTEMKSVLLAAKCISRATLSSVSHLKSIGWVVIRFKLWLEFPLFSGQWMSWGLRILCSEAWGDLVDHKCRHYNFEGFWQRDCELGYGTSMSSCPLRHGNSVEWWLVSLIRVGCCSVVLPHFAINKGWCFQLDLLQPTSDVFSCFHLQRCSFPSSGVTNSALWIGYTYCKKWILVSGVSEVQPGFLCR